MGQEFIKQRDLPLMVNPSLHGGGGLWALRYFKTFTKPVFKYEINKENVSCSSYFSFSLDVGISVKMKINEIRLGNMATYTSVLQRWVLHFVVLYGYRDNNLFTSKSVLLF